MLVLSRKPSQEILIDNDVRLKILDVSGQRVTLGVEAPDDRSILRGELTTNVVAPAPPLPARRARSGQRARPARREP